MPSTSPAQARLMAARAHGANFPMAKKIPLGVAQEFNQADKDGKMLSARHAPTKRSKNNKTKMPWH